MIVPEDFLQHLAGNGVSFFTGVPDSLLKGLLASLQKKSPRYHIVAANEGAAVALAAGYHLATGGVPVVYLQNSGLGNAVNPLTSLTDRAVYSMPLVLMVGWRGEPGIADEPQHVVMGKITPALLNLLHIPFIVLKKEDPQGWRGAVDEVLSLCRHESRPAALLVEAGVFAEDDAEGDNGLPLSSADAIEAVYNQLRDDDTVVCTTGKIGRAFYQLAEARKKISRSFLNVGSMGHALSLATGLALQLESRVVLFDGDGALLMHTGPLALPPALGLRNLKYVLLNNGAHQSVGSQPTAGFAVDFCTIAGGFGFTRTRTAATADELKDAASALDDVDFLEVRINTKTNDPLPRPTQSPREAKEQLMRQLGVLR